MAQARAELVERILKKLNLGATFREIESIYGVGYREARTFISTLKVHMTVEETNFIREVAETYNMLPGEVLVHFGVECAKRALQNVPAAPDSAVMDARRRSVISQVYNKMTGTRGDLYVSPAPPKAAPKKKTKVPEKKTTTRNK